MPGPHASAGGECPVPGGAALLPGVPHAPWCPPAGARATSLSPGWPVACAGRPHAGGPPRSRVGGVVVGQAIGGDTHGTPPMLPAWPPSQGVTGAVAPARGVSALSRGARSRRPWRGRGMSPRRGGVHVSQRGRGVSRSGSAPRRAGRWAAGGVHGGALGRSRRSPPGAPPRAGCGGAWSRPVHEARGGHRAGGGREARRRASPRPLTN